MNEGKFENYCAFAVVVVLAVGLWLWSCTFSGLYSKEGALFIRIVAGLFAATACIEIAKYHRPHLFGIEDTEPLLMEAATPRTPRERKPRKPRSSRAAAAMQAQAPTLWDQLPQEPTPAPVHPAEAKPMAAPRQVAHTLEAEATTPQQAIFNDQVADIMCQTNVTTATPSNVWHHYQAHTSQWVEALQSIGFTLHHRKANQMQDILLTSDTHLCKVTCVSGHINVMFFASHTQLNNNIDRTLQWLASLS